MGTHRDCETVFLDMVRHDGNRHFTEPVGHFLTDKAVGAVATAATGSPIAGQAAESAASRVVSDDIAHEVGSFAVGAGLYMAGNAAVIVAIVTAPIWIPALSIKKEFFD